MNNLQLYVSLLKYSISNPGKGIQLLKSTYQVWRDTNTKQHNHKYNKIKYDAHEVIQTLFPEEFFDFNEYKKNLISLQNEVFLFFQKLEDQKYPSHKKPYPTIYQIDNESAYFLYILCRILKPKAIVETGVAYGLSSAYILQAFIDNNEGMLYSIDSVFRPWESEEMIGSIIPTTLRNRWKFVNGIATKKLKDMLDSLGKIDIFLHDSLHTYQNMMFEFNLVWPYIKKQGFLISDDIASNNAFFDFCTKNNLSPIILSQKNQEKSFLGIVRKP